MKLLESAVLICESSHEESRSRTIIVGAGKEPGMKMRGIKANFDFNVAGPIVSLAVTLIATPIFVSHIGLARFGLLAIIWRLLGYFSFLDLGRSRASANALAKLRDPSSQEKRAKVLMTAFWLNLSLGIATQVPPFGFILAAYFYVWISPPALLNARWPPAFCPRRWVRPYTAGAK